jgi:hypothetical protein
VHRPVSEEKRAILLAKPEPAPLPIAGAVDGNGVPVPAAHGLSGRLRATANRVISESVPMPATNGHSNGHGGNGHGGNADALAGEAEPAAVADQPARGPGPDAGPPARGAGPAAGDTDS